MSDKKQTNTRMQKYFLAKVKVSRDLLNRLIAGMRLPSQPLFVELDDNLWAFHIRDSRWYQISFFGAFPFDQERQFAAGIRSPNNFLGVQTAIEALRLFVALRTFFRRRLIFRRPRRFFLFLNWLLMGFEICDQIWTVQICLRLPAVFRFVEIQPF